MNYFELYNLPESFHIDSDLINQRLYELNDQNPIGGNADNDAPESYPEIYEAYHVLSNPGKRMVYILSLHNLLDDGAKPQLPSEFLSLIIDLEKRLMLVDDAEKLGKITEETLSAENDLDEQLQTLTTDYEQLTDTAKENRLNEIAEIYYKKKYLLRIKESLNTFAARF